MVYRIPKNDRDDCEEINQTSSEIDVLLCACESHVRFAQGSLDGSAKPANGNQQSDGNENANVRENDRNGYDCDYDDDITKLTNRKKLQLVLRRHGSNENKMSDGGRERPSLGVKEWKSS